MDLILGNLCSLLAMVTDSISTACKTAKGVLIAQTVSQIIYGVGSVILKGYSAAAQNLVNLLRNAVAIRGIKKPAVEWTLVALALGLGILCNNRGLVGLLPVIGNLEYSIVVFRFSNNERALKLAFLICLILYAVFNLVILNVLGALSNVVVGAMIVIALCKK